MTRCASIDFVGSRLRRFLLSAARLLADILDKIAAAKISRVMCTVETRVASTGMMRESPFWIARKATPGLNGRTVG